METIEPIHHHTGQILFPICKLPKSVARAWLDELAENHHPEKPISIEQQVHVDGEMTELFIIETWEGYYLITDPSTED